MRKRNTKNNKKNTTHNDKTISKTYYYSVGVCQLGNIAIQSLIKESQQLDKMRVYNPRMKASLTQKERDIALHSLTFVTEKCCGRVKGCTCVDRQPQRAYVSKEDSASPTVSPEALHILFGITSHEEQQIMVADIAGAYLNADMNELIIMKFEGAMVDYVVASNPEHYQPYVTFENGKKVLYVELLKALYGCMQSALLWYKLFATTLSEMGFELNPYNLCVANKVINNRQCTIGFYVDDLFATHYKKKVLEQIRDKIEVNFGEMGVTFGDQQTYLGMDLFFDRKSKKVEITMKSHLQDAINTFTEVGSIEGRPPSTPTKRELFTVDVQLPLLDDNKQKSSRQSLQNSFTFPNEPAWTFKLASHSYAHTRKRPLPRIGGNFGDWFSTCMEPLTSLT